MDFKDYWNKTHLEHSNEQITYDNWLDEYKNIILFSQKPILDLGCGLGNNTLYLKEKGLDVISLDYSEVALNYLKEHIEDAKTMQFDISKPLPFDSDSFDLIIADLSLHYFNNETTINIMNEIKRILTPGGHLLARVNSIKDINYGANEGDEIEEHYYFVNGYNKRFFTLIDCIKYFSLIGDVKVEEDIVTRYSKPKVVYKVIVEKL